MQYGRSSAVVAQVKDSLRVSIRYRNANHMMLNFWHLYDLMLLLCDDMLRELWPVHLHILLFWFAFAN